MSNITPKKTLTIVFALALALAIASIIIKWATQVHKLETKPPSKDALSTKNEQLPCTKDSLNFTTDEFYIKVPCNRVPGMPGYTGPSIGDALLLIKAFNGDNLMDFDHFIIEKNGTPVSGVAINIQENDYQTPISPDTSCVVTIRVELFWDANNNRASSNTLVYYLKDHTPDRHIENDYESLSSTRYSTDKNSCGTDTNTLSYYTCLDGLAHHEADHTLIREINPCN